MTLNKQVLDEILLQFLNYNHKLSLSLHIWELVPSTNQKLWELIDAGATLPIVAIACSQSAGRGQWGRHWQSLPGGLYLSLGLTTDIIANNASHITLFSAWGIATALRHYNVPVMLKWPNDLILQGRKLGGIKSETRIQQRKITQAVIGVGINWTNPVPEKGINLQSFYQTQQIGSITSLEMLAAVTISGILSGYERYLSDGIESLLVSYSELLNILGRTIVVNGSPGVAIGVNSNGELKVRLQSSGVTKEICVQPGQISLGYD